MKTITAEPGTVYDWNRKNISGPLFSIYGSVKVFCNGEVHPNVLRCQIGPYGWLVKVKVDDEGKILLNDKGDGVLEETVYGNVELRYE